MKEVVVFLLSAIATVLASELYRALRRNAELFAAVVRVANERDELAVLAQRLRAANQQLGQWAQAAGLPVTVIPCGEENCQDCGDEWPEALEEING